MIEPTIGRVLWLHQPDPNGDYPPDHQPNAALIVYVRSKDRINIAWFDASGRAHGLEAVHLWNGEGERPLHRYCEWMPYQKGQAAKTEELERAAHHPV